MPRGSPSHVQLHLGIVAESHHNTKKCYIVVTYKQQQQNGGHNAYKRLWRRTHARILYRIWYLVYNKWYSV